MKIEYNNLYTHFMLITANRYPIIPEVNRERIEKYMTGIVNNNNSNHKKITFTEEYNEFVKHYQKTLKWDLLR